MTDEYDRDDSMLIFDTLDREYQADLDRDDGDLPPVPSRPLLADGARS